MGSKGQSGQVKKILSPNRPISDASERYFLWKLNAILLEALRQGGFIPPEGGFTRDGIIFINRLIYTNFRESWTALWESQIKRNSAFPSKKDWNSIRALDRWFLFHLKAIILTAIYTLSKIDGLIIEVRKSKGRDAFLPYDLKSHLNRLLPQILSDYDVSDALICKKPEEKGQEVKKEAMINKEIVVKNEVDKNLEQKVQVKAEKAEDKKEATGLSNNQAR